MGGLATGPERAAWSVLEVGCGEGQFACEIAERYPNARVVGVDVDSAAIEAASRRSAAIDHVEFAVHDARLPLPAGDFAVAVSWLVLMYLPDKRSSLAHVAAALQPGRVLLLCNQPDQPAQFSHPVAAELLAAGMEMAGRFGIIGIEDGLVADLEAAGFGDVVTVALEYPLGGATSLGQRWWAHLLATTASMRRAVVDVGRLTDGAEFDRKVELLAGESMLRHSGTWRFLVTLARKTIV